MGEGCWCCVHDIALIYHVHFFETYNGRGSALTQMSFSFGEAEFQVFWRDGCIASFTGCDFDNLDPTLGFSHSERFETVLPIRCLDDWLHACLCECVWSL